MQVPQAFGSAPALLGEEPTANASEAGEGWLGFGGKGPNEQENLHLYVLKRVLGVNKSTSSLLVLAEFGRLPLYVYKWKQILRYWNRLIDMATETGICQELHITPARQEELGSFFHQEHDM